MAGLYIHIPFCASRCIYCGFYSTVPSERVGARPVEERYVDALCHEMELKEGGRDGGAPAELSSIYLGGGTPSQLSFPSLQKLFRTIGRVYRTENRWGGGAAAADPPLPWRSPWSAIPTM